MARKKKAEAVEPDDGSGGGFREMIAWLGGDVDAAMALASQYRATFPNQALPERIVRAFMSRVFPGRTIEEKVAERVADYFIPASKPEPKKEEEK